MGCVLRLLGGTDFPQTPPQGEEESERCWGGVNLVQVIGRNGCLPLSKPSSEERIHFLDIFKGKLIVLYARSARNFFESILRVNIDL